MSSILLIYPFFKPIHDRSIFRFPPLGIGYVGASIRNAGHEVKVIDCTFTDRQEALNQAINSNADVVGIYSMASMKEDTLRFARALRNKDRLLITGGPLPSSDPISFMNDFDIVVREKLSGLCPSCLKHIKENAALIQLWAFSITRMATASPEITVLLLPDHVHMLLIWIPSLFRRETWCSTINILITGKRRARMPQLQ